MSNNNNITTKLVTMTEQNTNARINCAVLEARLESKEEIVTLRLQLERMNEKYDKQVIKIESLRRENELLKNKSSIHTTNTATIPVPLVADNNSNNLNAKNIRPLYRNIDAKPLGVRFANLVYWNENGQLVGFVPHPDQERRRGGDDLGEALDRVGLFEIGRDTAALRDADVSLLGLLEPLQLSGYRVEAGIDEIEDVVTVPVGHKGHRDAGRIVHHGDGGTGKRALGRVEDRALDAAAVILRGGPRREQQSRGRPGRTSPNDDRVISHVARSLGCGGLRSNA